VNREEKAAVIARTASDIRESAAVIAIDYRGITVKQAGDLRVRLRDAGASFRVVKNTLTERAADEADSPVLKTYLEGPTAFAFVRGDAAMAAKAIYAFRRESQLLEIKGGLMDGQALSADEVESIARLPTRDVLQAQFVGVVASPLSGLVRGLSGLVSGIAVALGQIREQGLLGAEAPPADSEPSESPADAAAESEPAPSEAPGDPVAEAAAAEDQTADEAPEGATTQGES
jgi:large subunit ribosomal protein L10